jgi:hypothetical protein
MGMQKFRTKAAAPITGGMGCAWATDSTAAAMRSVSRAHHHRDGAIDNIPPDCRRWFEEGAGEDEIFAAPEIFP